MTSLIQFVAANVLENRANATVVRDASPEGGPLLDLAVELEQEADLAEEVLYETLQLAALLDAEYGCCHDAEALLAGGRSAEFTGDEFDPLPPDCHGVTVAAPLLKIVARFWSSAEDFDPAWAAEPVPARAIDTMTLADRSGVTSGDVDFSA